MNALLAAFACLAVFSTAHASGHGLLLAGHGGWAGYGHGGANYHGSVGPAGVVTGAGAAGPSGVVTGAGTAGPAGAVNGHGAVGPNGVHSSVRDDVGHGWAGPAAAWGGWGHGAGLGLGYGLGHAGVVVAGPAAHGAVLAGPGYGWGGHGHGHWW